MAARVRLDHYLQLVRAELHQAINVGRSIADCVAHARGRVPFWSDDTIADALTDRGADPLLRCHRRPAHRLPPAPHPRRPRRTLAGWPGPGQLRPMNRMTGRRSRRRASGKIFHAYSAEAATIHSLWIVAVRNENRWDWAGWCSEPPIQRLAESGAGTRNFRFRKSAACGQYPRRLDGLTCVP
ncbi:conserved hypothetical protein [Frankia alni ACN14a]|uniref:Uncharacterized protein n=1 Tax=Frankia alni (strain DSM 45986 / CECT 9034 / ACN14a) TaxID=326424 RepID=Q0RSG7_FRAAA|nr:conserved hypothetical protein [Frankia alni ACN14a]